MSVRVPTVLLSLLCGCALAATEPNDATRRWWSHVEALAGDAMRGRDTGSVGYRKAAHYVARQFARNGLKPAGESGFYQRVPIHAVRFLADRSDIEIIRRGGVERLRWLRQVFVPASNDLPNTINAGLVFVGSSSYARDVDVTGRILVVMNPARYTATPIAPTLPDGTVPDGAIGVLGIDSTAGPEPVGWPRPYSVAFDLKPPPPPINGRTPLVMSFNPAFADLLFAGSGHTYAELLDRAARGERLPNFVLPATLRAHMRVERADLTSENVLAVLPGADPRLASEVIVVSAHLDGYGIGEPRHGDRIYNGAFDDAAYVATLVELAERLHESRKTLKRSVLFCIVTGEEKGLLGSRYFMQHPTIPKERMIADLNLDILRPIVPLTRLTVLGLDDSPLGETVRHVAETLGIRVQPDPEPRRNLARRSDQAVFVQAGVPALGFVFGYEPGSAEESVYRRWYAERYHGPGDDLKQPWDPSAAEAFNRFFYRLVETLGDAPADANLTR